MEAPPAGRTATAQGERGRRDTNMHILFGFCHYMLQFLQITSGFYNLTFFKPLFYTFIHLFLFPSMLEKCRIYFVLIFIDGHVCRILKFEGVKLSPRGFIRLSP